MTRRQNFDATAGMDCCFVLSLLLLANPDRNGRLCVLATGREVLTCFCCLCEASLLRRTSQSVRYSQRPIPRSFTRQLRPHRCLYDPRTSAMSSFLQRKPCPPRFKNFMHKRKVKFAWREWALETTSVKMALTQARSAMRGEIRGNLNKSPCKERFQ